MNRHRIFNCRDQKSLAQPKPHVPVFDETHAGIETTLAEQARLPREHSRHGYEVVFEQLPENIAGGTLQRIDLACRQLTTRVTNQSLTVAERKPIVSGDCLQLHVE